MMTQLTIKRSEWARGNPLVSSLFNAVTSRYCCLGLYLRDVAKFPNEVLSRGDSPGLIACEIEKGPKEIRWLTDDSDRFKNSALAKILMTVNDEPFYTDLGFDRETRIAELFRQQDIEVTFVD